MEVTGHFTELELCLYSDEKKNINLIELLEIFEFILNFNI